MLSLIGEGACIDAAHRVVCALCMLTVTRPIRSFLAQEMVNPLPTGTPCLRKPTETSWVPESPLVSSKRMTLPSKAKPWDGVVSVAIDVDGWNVELAMVKAHMLQSLAWLEYRVL